MRATTPVLLALIGLLFAPISVRAATPQVLWSFCAAHFCTDGAHPTAGVIVDKVGDVFGTTAGDLQSDPNGDPHKSTLFGVGPGLSVVLGSPYYRFVEFCAAINCTDGAQAASNIIGTVSTTAVTAYGTTVGGGANNGGTIFKATLTTHQTIYSFCSKKDSFSSCSDGGRPGDIVQDAAGNIYGTTQAGGANAGSPSGPGVLYKLDANGVMGLPLHDFCSNSKCTDGVQPYGRQLALHDGALYGTTYTGGKFNAGVVFRYGLTTKIFDVLYDFCKKANCTDGQYPQAGVTFDPVTGILYGATQAGGKGKGILYAITKPTGTAAAAAASFVPLTVFCSSGGTCADGASPGWAPAPDGNGHLIGATYGGGASGAGLIYEVTIASPAKPKILYSFCPGGHCDTGAYPEGSLTLYPQGSGKAGVAIPWTSIYGVTIYGGTNNGVPNGGGTVFKLTP